jgi:hypothetical protein
MKMKRKLLVFACALLISGCVSIGRGIAEAFLESQNKIDSRQCEIWGEGFSGIESYLQKNDGKMKVLMIHGVGEHLPGYATEFAEKLAKELDLSVMSKRHKNIALTDPADKTKKLGNLRIDHFLDSSKTKELLFYELTWSEITEKQKEVLAYDNSGEYSFRRAKVNDLMKKFSNDTSPDPIIYLSKSKNEMLTAFMQSFCWMNSGGWEELPKEGRLSCELNIRVPLNNITNDNYAFVTHSLGSRITIDGLQLIAEQLSHPQSQGNSSKLKELAAALKLKHIPIYMMSNQLPMLQLGRELPEIKGKHSEYCQADGKYYAERMLAKTSIIAFSDPNDLLGYAIPQGFIEKYLDSRLCVDVTNININVATVFDAFGLGEVANPLDAHIGYDTDDRVVALIAKGIGDKNTADIVKNRCRWIETID